MKDNIRIRNIKMAEAISLNNDRELWEETRKITISNNSPNYDGWTYWSR